MEPVEVRAGATTLAAYDHGGPPGAPGALLLHGLAGHAGEWRETAAWLSRTHRVVALDLRGHGRSERRPRDLSREAFVADALAVIERFGLAPALLVGQSMGGNTAFLAAAARPDLVAALVVAEASPDGPLPDLAEGIERALGSWPAGFGDRSEALAFFRGRGLPAEAWADGLLHTGAGLAPRWDLATMVACARELGARSWWPQWREVGCPVLVVAGERSMGAEHAREMAAASPRAGVAVIEGAGHEVHLEAPGAWRRALEAFLAGIGAGGGPA